MARSAFHRAGIQPGWNAIDCGCGPIGGLAVLSDLVGPTGRVVGVDFNPPRWLRRGRSRPPSDSATSKCSPATSHAMDPATLGGPFDLAYTRLFLTHQPDPVRTLRQIAGLLRPGGWLVAHEPLPTPPPKSHPDLAALADYWALLHQMLQRAGVPAGAVEDLPRSARAAGFEVVELSGHFMDPRPALGFELHAATVAAARERAIPIRLATERQIDELVDALRGAKDGDYGWVTSPFFLNLTLRKPMDGLNPRGAAGLCRGRGSVQDLGQLSRSAEHRPVPCRQFLVSPRVAGHVPAQRHWWRPCRVPARR